MAGLFSSELPWLLALIFVLLGAGVFYLSSLVSGHNIYRDLRVEVAMLATGMVGILLFIFSPLSYIVLTPSLYITGFEKSVKKIRDEDPTDKLIARADKLIALATTIYEKNTGRSLADNPGAANTSQISESQKDDCHSGKKGTTDEEKELLNVICKIHKLTIAVPDGILYPYLLSAFALGLMFGCAQVVRPRELFLDYIRRFTDISFSIYSYQFSWDRFLHSIKTNGEISVLTTDQNEVTGQRKVTGHRMVTRENEVTGRLRAFSVKEEPKEIMLETEDCRILVTKSDAIGHLRVPKGSYKRHHMQANPSSYAFYLMIMLVGLLLFFFSSSLTARFTAKQEFHYLAQAYWIFALGLFITYLSCIVIAIPRILGSEFSNWKSALLLHPACFWSLWLHWGLAILAIRFHILLIDPVFDLSSEETQYRELVLIIRRFATGLMFGAYVIILVCMLKKRRDIAEELEEMVKVLLLEKNPDYGSLKNLEKNLEFIYQKQDLNNKDPEYWKKLLLQLVPPAGTEVLFYAKLADKVDGITKKSGARIGSVLERDQFAIVNRLRFLVAKQLKKEGWL